MEGGLELQQTKWESKETSWKEKRLEQSKLAFTYNYKMNQQPVK